MESWFIESAGTDRVPVVATGRQGEWHYPLVFTASERLGEFVRQRKPEWATVTPKSFDAQCPAEFADFIDAVRLRSGRPTHFTVDPPADGGRFWRYSIARYLRGLERGDPCALENAKELPAS